MRAVRQHPAGLPDGGRPEPGAAAVGGAEVERNTGDRDRGPAVTAGNPEEARRHRIAGWRAGHGVPGPGSRNRNTAAATAQVQSPPRTPSVAAVIDWV